MHADTSKQQLLQHTDTNVSEQACIPSPIRYRLNGTSNRHKRQGNQAPNHMPVPMIYHTACNTTEEIFTQGATNGRHQQQSANGKHRQLLVRTAGVTCRVIWPINISGYLLVQLSVRMVSE